MAYDLWWGEQWRPYPWHRTNMENEDAPSSLGDCSTIAYHITQDLAILTNPPRMTTSFPNRTDRKTHHSSYDYQELTVKQQNSKPHAFVAFPAKPKQLFDSIERAIKLANERSMTIRFRGWPENDIAGRPLTPPILQNIGTSVFVISDITELNFNVTYEIGFTIGSAKRVYLVRNKSYKNDTAQISRVGIYDTLGYIEYSDSNSLAKIMTETNDRSPIDIKYKLDRKTPLYVLETPYRGDVMHRITSRIKKARLQYRSFSPSEEIRLAATDAIKHVSTSHGVVIPLLSHRMRDHHIHNIRAAFVAGLAHGMEKPTRLLQKRRDFVVSHAPAFSMASA